MSATGSCLCGAVKFEAESVEPHIHACHCSTCRNWTGGPMLATQAEGLTFTGEEHIRNYSSSAWAERGFCIECGTCLYYRMKDPVMYMMATGSFDDAEQFKLEGEIYVDEKPGCYRFAGDHPRLTGEEFMASIMQGDQ